MPKKPAETTTRLPPLAFLRRLLSARKTMENDINESRGTYGQLVSEGTEKKHLHKKAWAVVVREDKMEPAALKLYYEHLDYMREELGLIKRAASAPELPMADEEDADDEKTNVKPFPAPTSVAAE